MLLLTYFFTVQDFKFRDDLKVMQNKSEELPRKKKKAVPIRRSREGVQVHPPDGVASSSSSSGSIPAVAPLDGTRPKTGRRLGKMPRERNSDGQVVVPRPTPPPPLRTLSCPQLPTDLPDGVGFSCEPLPKVLESNGLTNVIVATCGSSNEKRVELQEATCSNTMRPVPHVQPRKTHSRSRSDVPHGTRFPDIFTNIPKPVQDKATRRRSLLEEGGSIVVPTTECFFPQPEKGQSLTSFLSSEDFQTCAELDRENAHFYISEALISAMEQIRCNQAIRRAVEEDEVEESDEEIQHLKQRIRIRRCERQQEKARQKYFALLSDGKTDTATSQSASSPLSSTCTGCSDDSSIGTEDDVDELELSDTNNSTTLSSMQGSGLCMSMASLYSDADIKRVTNTDNEDSLRSSQEGGLSAEGVALSLLKKFKEKQLPKASDLEWLVSEQDAPQRLLPLPDSWPISPDDADLTSKKTRLRGTADWAPPRAQIIFNIHPNPNRKLLVARQKYQCAGCGLLTDPGYIGRFRYCEYLGKYFCQCCHANKTSVIPARILRRWDFGRYPVSNFSQKVLDRLHTDPLFNVLDLNYGLYRKVRRLDATRTYRIQMYHLKDYINTCKAAQKLCARVADLPQHWFHEPHLYSMHDFLQVKHGHLSEQLKQLTGACVEHVRKCPVCAAKGFFCETCRNSGDIIYPFQLMRVQQCTVCGACFHRECFVPTRCPKCARIEARHCRIEETIYSSDEDVT